MNRRMADGGLEYSMNEDVLIWNTVISMGAWTLGLFQLPFIFNFFWSIKKGERVGNNPWKATTLEWSAPSPPPHGNFIEPPEVHRGPYDYSVPGSEVDFLMQTDADGPQAEPAKG